MSTFDNNPGSKSIRNPTNMSMKSILNKSNNGIYNKSASKVKKNQVSSKHSHTAKKGSKSKKSGKEGMNIVPFNGYVPDIITNEF